jgi:DNA-binding XRE family transcriptional regulator
MYVYIVPLKDQSAFKIGKAEDPARRIGDLRDWHDLDTKFRVIMCGDTQESFRVESVLHATLDQYRMRLPHQGGTEFFEWNGYEHALALSVSVSSARFLSWWDVDQGNRRTFDQNETDVWKSHLASCIKTNRLARFITQTEMADAVGSSKSTIQKIESGLSIGTSIDTILRILSLLSVDLFSEAPIAQTLRARATKRQGK